MEEHVTRCSAGTHSGTGRQHFHILRHYTVWRRVVWRRNRRSTPGGSDL